MGFLDIFSGKTSENQKDSDLLIKGNKYYRSNRLDDALTAFSQALELNPQNIEALCMKSVVLFDLEKYRESVEILEKSLSLFNIELPLKISDSDWWAKMGKFFLEKKSYPQGLSFSNASLIFNPENMDAWFLKAQLMYRYGIADKAVECMNRGLVIVTKGTALYKERCSSERATKTDHDLYRLYTEKQIILEEIKERMIRKTWK